MAWSAVSNNVSYLAIVLYFGAIFWTLGYDTIYGLQDASDDEIIGVKSTAIKFKNNLNVFVGTCYFISSVLILFVIVNLELNYFLILFVLFIMSLFYQLKIYDKNNPDACLRAFKLNNLSGLFLFLTFFSLTIEI